MRIARLFWIVVAIAALSTAARAADKAWEDCSQVVDRDRSIAGCTKFLARGDSESRQRQAFVYLARGNAYFQKHDYDRTIRDLDQAIRLDPKGAPAYYIRGVAYRMQGDYDRAIRDFDSAIRLDPKDGSSYRDRGNAYAGKGDNDRAVRDYDQAIRLDPKDGSAYRNRGNAYAGKGDHDRAIRDYDQAIRLDPKNSFAYNSRGDAYLSKGDHDSAIADFDEAIRLDSKNARAYILRGTAYRHKDDYDRAIADFDEVIRFSTDDVARQLARIERDETQQALAAAQAAPPAAVPSITSVQPVTLPAARLSEARVALVIGNANYAAQSPLKNPSNDARAIADALRGAGFKKVDVAENLSRDALVKVLQAFQEEADRADWAVIYFSGHGVEIGGVNYVVPTDARLLTDRNAPDEAVSLDRLMASVGGAHKLRIVILDACRDNPFVASMRRTIASRSAGKGLAPVEPTRATLVVYAARDGQLAQDGAGDNSPFAAALARRLGEPHVEVSKLFRLVTDDVLDATGRAQQPFVYGSLPGREDFYFRP